MNPEKNLIEDIQTHLDQSADILDAHTLSKITAARNKALDQQQPFYRKWGMPLAGLATAAAVCYLAVSLFVGQEARQNISPDPGQAPVPATASSTPVPRPEAATPVAREDEQIAKVQIKPPDPVQSDSLKAEGNAPETSPVIQPQQVELVALLASGQRLEFFEDIEFYTWLTENPEEIAGS